MDRTFDGLLIFGTALIILLLSNIWIYRVATVRGKGKEPPPDTESDYIGV